MFGGPRIIAGVAGLIATSPALATCSLGLSELPVTMAGLRPLLETKVNGVETPFMVDSGAFYSMITPGAAARLGLRTRAMPAGLTISGANGAADASVATIKLFTIAGVNVPNIDFIVAGGAIGAESAGVIGQNVLGIFDVEYDLANGAMRLIKAKGCERKMLAYWAKGVPYMEVPMEARTGRMSHAVVTVSVNGVKLRAMLDTGAATSVIALGGARRAGIRPTGPGVEIRGLSGGIGSRAVRTWVAPVGSFAIGGLRVNRTKIAIGDMDLGIADMLLGDDFFLSNRVYIANSQNKVYFTYNGGRMFNLGPAQANAKARKEHDTFVGADPTEASGFARRGNALLARGDTNRAIADLTRAIELAPTEPRYYFARARAHAEAKDETSAVKDLDSALKNKADDAEVLTMRAEMRFKAHDLAGARADADAASKAASAQADLRIDLGQIYTELDLFAPAIAEYDKWLSFHAAASQTYAALNGRCWASGLGDIRLDSALRDCDLAVRRSLRSPGTLDSRGMVHLRRGEFDKAVADYDLALSRVLGMTWSLYGRGIAKAKLGRKAESEADIVAATRSDEAVIDRAKKLGIVP